LPNVNHKLQGAATPERGGNEAPLWLTAFGSAYQNRSRGFSRANDLDC